MSAPTSETPVSLLQALLDNRSDQLESLGGHLDAAVRHDIRARVIARLMHDFNNAMTGICSLSELCALSAEDGEADPENLGLIRDNALRAQQYLRRIVGLNAEPSASGPAYADPLVEAESLRDLFPVVLPKGAGFELRGEESGTVPADPVRLRLVFLHFALLAHRLFEANGRDALFALILRADPAGGFLVKACYHGPNLRLPPVEGLFELPAGEPDGNDPLVAERLALVLDRLTMEAAGGSLTAVRKDDGFVLRAQLPTAI